MGKVKKTKKTVISDSLIERAWTNLNEPSSLTSLTAFAKTRKSGESLQDLERSLSRIEAFSRHRPLKRKILRPSYIINRQHVSYCVDLMEFPDKYHNNGNAFLLLLMDQFSRMIALEPLKRKSKEDTAAGLEKALKRLGRGHNKFKSYITCDQGKEFKNRNVYQLLQKYNIEMKTMSTANKVSFCERGNRTIKEYLHRLMTLKKTKNWVSSVHLIEKKYNSTKHSSHKFRPIDISDKTSSEAFSNMYKRLVVKARKSPKFSVAQLVRVADRQNVWTKKYKPQYSKQVFKISEIKNTYPVFSYRIQTLSGEPVEQLFVSQELSLVTPP